jgi:long-chain acyl-CoA synthetase
MAKTMLPLAQGRRTVYHLLKAAELTWGSAPALRQPSGGGEYRTYTWIDYRQIAEEIAAALRRLGIGQGDIVALASETRAEFYLADVGIMTNGSIAAAVYTSLAPAEQVRTLKGCSPKAVFVENPKTMRTLLAAGADAIAAIWILMDGEAEDTLTFERLRETGQKELIENPHLVERFASEVQREDYAILYLTSGATGEPKMGLVTHGAILANLDMGPFVLPVGADDTTLAFLPSAHITQRLVMELLMIRHGTQVWFSEGLSRMPKELQAIRPTFFVAPPRVWERIYTSVATEIRKKPLLLRRLIYLGIGVGSEAARKHSAGKRASPLVRSSLKFFDRLVFRKIRERLGGRLRVAVSGSAPLGKDLAEFYRSIGLPMIEGYGLTEGGVLCLNPLDRPVAGSIGRPLPGVEMRIAGDGELLVKSPSLFSGYYQDPEASAAVLKDGWLYTGDLATIDERGFVWITGRKKELIVSSNGKKIYPSRIEGLFKLEPLVNQVLLIGDKLPYVTAIFTINPAAAEQLRGNQGKPLAELARSAAVQDEMKRVVQRVNKHLASFEQIRKFKVLERDFSLEAGELTPTMKLRRAKVLENFKKDVGEFYAGREDF